MHITNLERVQKFAARLATGKWASDPTSLCNDLGWWADYAQKKLYYDMLLCPEECSIMLKPNPIMPTLCSLKKLQWCSVVAFKLDLMDQFRSPFTLKTYLAYQEVLQTKFFAEMNYSSYYETLQ